MRMKFFPAKGGDAALIQLQDGTNILVDMGYIETYQKYIRPELVKLHNAGKCIDLLIITHIDEDHIQGAIEFICDNEHSKNPKIIEVKEIWHNSYRHLQFDKEKKDYISAYERMHIENILSAVKDTTQHRNDEFHTVSAKQGSTLASLIYKYGYELMWNRSFGYGAIMTESRKPIMIGDACITLLSPSILKLKNLADLWMKELHKIDDDFNISDEHIFDDAYELYMRNLKIASVDSELKDISEDIEDIRSMLKLNLMRQSKDYSVSNGSSIGFILCSEGKRILMLGDAHEDVIMDGLSEYQKSEDILKFDLIKLSHHGSEKNNLKLLDYCTADNYVVSTDGYKHGHPDSITIAKIIKTCSKQVNLCFTYPVPVTDQLQTIIEEDKLQIHLIKGDGEETIQIEL